MKLSSWLGSFGFRLIWLQELNAEGGISILKKDIFQNCLSEVKKKNSIGSVRKVIDKYHKQVDKKM